MAGGAWYALWRDADGPHQKRLGPAHVRDSGRRTARGAVVWRAVNGSKPDPSWLTPAEAEDALERLLSSGDAGAHRPAPQAAGGPHVRRSVRRMAHLCGRREGRAPVDGQGLPQHRASIPGTRVRRGDPAAHDRHGARRRVQRADAGRKLSRRTIQKILVLLRGILKRAKRKGWIAANPTEDSERVTVRRTAEFNVLSSEEVHAVARAEPSELCAAIYITAAFAGLRMGELRALR
jgi:hypothetical protein